MSVFLHIAYDIVLGKYFIIVFVDALMLIQIPEFLGRQKAEGKISLSCAFIFCHHRP